MVWVSEEGLEMSCLILSRPGQSNTMPLWAKSSTSNHCTGLDGCRGCGIWMSVPGIIRQLKTLFNKEKKNPCVFLMEIWGVLNISRMGLLSRTSWPCGDVCKPENISKFQKRRYISRFQIRPSDWWPTRNASLILFFLNMLKNAKFISLAYLIR